MAPYQEIFVLWRLVTLLSLTLLSKNEQFCPLTAGLNREFKQITTAGATTAAVTEKVWGEYVSVV